MFSVLLHLLKCLYWHGRCHCDLDEVFLQTIVASVTSFVLEICYLWQDWWWDPKIFCDALVTSALAGVWASVVLLPWQWGSIDCMWCASCGINTFPILDKCIRFKFLALCKVIGHEHCRLDYNQALQFQKVKTRRILEGRGCPFLQINNLFIHVTVYAMQSFVAFYAVFYCILWNCCIYSL